MNEFSAIHKSKPAIKNLFETSLKTILNEWFNDLN